MRPGNPALIFGEKMKVYDKEGSEHDKDPVDANECVKLLGWSFTKERSKNKPELSQIDVIRAELQALGVDHSGVSGLQNLTAMLTRAKARA